MTSLCALSHLVPTMDLLPTRDTHLFGASSTPSLASTCLATATAVVFAPATNASLDGICKRRQLGVQQQRQWQRRQQTNLLDLLDEVFTMVLSRAAHAPHVDAAAAVCRRMHGLARDDRLWRVLFERDFTRIYTAGLPAEPWPGCLPPGQNWPKDARLFWDAALDTHLPMHPGNGDDGFHADAPVDTRAPKPFAHMPAADRNWRWLYIVHALPARKRTTAERGRRAGITVDKCNKHSSFLRPARSLIVYRGEVNADGLRDGYGVEIHHRDNGTIFKWMEARWRRGVPIGCWFYLNETRSVCTLASPLRSSPGVACITLRADVMRIWGPSISLENHGACLWINAADTRFRGVLRRGAPMYATAAPASGDRLLGCHYNAEGMLSGELAVRYASGDVAVLRCVRGSAVDVVWFQCAATCSDADSGLFVGHRIELTRWTILHTEAEAEGRPDMCAYAPAQDDASAEAMLFRRYVVGGHIGWGHAAQSLALAYVVSGSLSKLACAHVGAE